MIRIGIIGSENSHAMAFSQIFNTTDQYPDLRVVAIYGEDAAQSERIARECGVEWVAPSAGAMLGRVDAVMVTSRDGALHPGYATPFIDAGLPVFIDKPIANDGAESRALLDRAAARGVPVMGGSSVKFTADALALADIARRARAAGTLLGGHVWAPVKMVNPYGNFYFYASHLIETAMMIFGFDALFVQAERLEKGVYVLLAYADFAVHLTYMEEISHYGGAVLCADGMHTRAIDLSDSYAVEAAHFAQMVRTGAMPQPVAELAIPVDALNAIERAYTRGGRWPVAAGVLADC